MKITNCSYHKGMYCSTVNTCSKYCCKQIIYWKVSLHLHSTKFLTKVRACVHACPAIDADTSRQMTVSMPHSRISLATEPLPFSSSAYWAQIAGSISTISSSVVDFGFGAFSLAPKEWKKDQITFFSSNFIKQNLRGNKYMA